MSTNNLAFLRRRLNLSLTALSEMIQEPVSTLSRLESGERKLSDK
jgi:DNA-binding transcriptional regulator YiaG